MVLVREINARLCDGGDDTRRQRPVRAAQDRASRARPHEVLVRHTAVGLNFLDVYHRSGLYPWAVERDLIPGSEAAGRVVAVGDGVEDVRPGDRVAYTHPLGAYATARVITADRLVLLISTQN
ncbi:alcohol dehydrogenase catalytic domain-containing protein [Paracoccus sp. MC1862]|nr:alcohol dehydrogenase catalytic domain-containing protein [Paracoccus sp. MC1862]QQO45137.1 alcohol dehydrogenase catalytic domain-containing protein [Paracoccus sp. MC1862]